jgi:hypothetical protein
VTIDGNPAGTTNAAGLLTVDPVAPGKRVVLVSKKQYQEERREVTFVAGTDRALEVTLSPLPARLTVNVNLPDAEIRVGDTPARTGRVDDLEIAPGRYTVSVTKLGYRPYTGTVNLGPGQSARIDAAIEPLSLKDLVALAEDEFLREKYDDVVALCDMVLAEKPNRPRANLLLGASLFRLGRGSDSAAPLLKAIEGGERIAVPVRQHRPSLGPDEAEGPWS